MHFLYCAIVVEYIYVTYVQGNLHAMKKYAIFMGLFLIYPWLYDLTQLCYLGPRDYFKDGYNYIDLFYIYGGFTNLVFSRIHGPNTMFSKSIMLIIIVIIAMKSLFFLRIFENFTPVVVMLINVVSNLKLFLLFYIMLLFMYAQMYAVLGVGNLQRDGKFATKFNTTLSKSTGQYPGAEYTAIGPWVGNFLSAMRVSLGDYESVIEAASYLSSEDNYLFWIIWVQIVGITCIIFLNIVVAEAIASYKHVLATLESVILKEKSELITECENMTFRRYKSAENYPRFLITR